MFKQSLFRYSFYSILGIAIWNFALIGGGYLLASNWNVISENYKSYKYVIFLILLIIIFSFFAYKMYKKRIKTKNINGD